MTSYWHKSRKVKGDEVKKKIASYWRNICGREALPGDAKTATTKKNRAAPLNELHKFRSGPLTPNVKKGIGFSLILEVI